MGGHEAAPDVRPSLLLQFTSGAPAVSSLALCAIAEVSLPIAAVPLDAATAAEALIGQAPVEPLRKSIASR